MTTLYDNFTFGQLQSSNFITPTSFDSTHPLVNTDWYPTNFIKNVSFEGSTVFQDNPTVPGFNGGLSGSGTFFVGFAADPNIPASQIYGGAVGYPNYPANKFIIYENGSPSWYDWRHAGLNTLYNIHTNYSLSYRRDTGSFLDLSGATAVYLQGISIALSNNANITYESISVRTTITSRQNSFIVGQLQSGFFLLAPSVTNQYINLANFTQTGQYNPQYVTKVEFDFYIPRKLLENEVAVMNFKFSFDSISIV